MRRRLAAILQRWDVPLGELRGRLAMNSGADRPLLVAKADRAGNVVRLPDVDGCIEHVQRHAIGLLVVDPFVETHEVSENANEQIKAVAGDVSRHRPAGHVRGACWSITPPSRPRAAATAMPAT